ncbi:MAG TPA: YihY/virulence factor BrkB family protein [Bacteroidetes bacterium]|nr:YihY/virulence factor BrkB family protein [Bacteroidota bacterium]
MGIKEKVKQYQFRLKRALQRFYLMLNRVRPPGLGGAGLFDVAKFFFKAMTDKRFTLAGMAMSFRFFFAVFPALILIFTLIPFIPVDNLHEKVMTFLGSIVPGDSLGFMSRILDEFFEKPSASVIYINISLLLFSSLGGIKVMMRAFSKNNDLFRDRNFFRHNFVALLIMLALLLLFLVMLGLLIAGEVGTQYLVTENLMEKGLVTTLFRLFYWLILFVAVEIAVSILYYLGPATTIRWKFFSPGSLVGGILILLAINGFRLFFVQFADYNKIYGSLGAIMVLQVWFYWISIVLLIGFELNAAIAAAKNRQRLRHQEEEK